MCETEGGMEITVTYQCVICLVCETVGRKEITVIVSSLRFVLYVRRLEGCKLQ